MNSLSVLLTVGTINAVRCALTLYHDASVSLENTDQNVWGRDDDAIGCNMQTAYASIPKSGVLTTGLLLSGFKFSTAANLQANSRILKAEVRIRASADADTRSTPQKFHIGLDSIALRSGGLDIYTQRFNGEPRPQSATPVLFEVVLERNVLGTPLFRGDQVLTEMFGIVTYWRNHDAAASWYVYLDCIQIRLTFENDPPPTPAPPPRPTVTSTTVPMISTSTTTGSVIPTTPTTAATTAMGASNDTGVVLFTVVAVPDSDGLALASETVIAIVVPVAAGCVLCVTLIVIFVLRRRRKESKPPPRKTAAAADKGERRKDSSAVHVSNSAFAGKKDTAGAAAEPPKQTAVAAVVEAPTPAAAPAVLARSPTLVQPEKPTHFVISSYPGLRPPAQSAASAMSGQARAAPAGVIFVERGYDVPYSFDSDSQQVYMGEHGIAADFTPAVGREAQANLLLDRHVRDQYASPAKQNQVLDDIF